MRALLRQIAKPCAASVVLLLCLIMTCATPGPPSDEMTDDDLLALLDALRDARPYRSADIEQRLGVMLEESGASNAYFSVYASAEAPAPIASVEVRESKATPPADGLLLVGVAGSCITRAQVEARFGAPTSPVLRPPPPDAPQALPHYHTHRQPWGEVRFGYDPQSDCLRMVVFDGMS